jgi:hypothetical protein
LIEFSAVNIAWSLPVSASDIVCDVCDVCDVLQAMKTEAHGESTGDVATIGSPLFAEHDC